MEKLTIEGIEYKLKQLSLEAAHLESEKERLEDEQEISLKVVLRKQKYWKIGRQDFYCVGEKEYIEVSVYQGGGGFNISQGIPYDLEREESISRAGREPSTKEEFKEALQGQIDRIKEIQG